MERNEKLKEIAKQSHFNIYMSELWQGTAERFALAIVQECIMACPHEDARNHIRRHFGVTNEKITDNN